MSLSLIWPLPALLTWATAWMLFITLRWAGCAPAWAVVVGVTVGALLALWFQVCGGSRVRTLLMALGFPLSFAASGFVTGAAAFWWLLPLTALLALYPLRSWQDAPLFPTPRAALQGLADATALLPGSRVVDAGCGLGDGLFALRQEFPQAHLTGWEWSRLLRCLCAWRCHWRNTPAQVMRADIWAVDWSSFDLVYLFQRPESMSRAMAKAAAEMRAGSWLVSLEFEAVGWKASGRLETVVGKPVWLYRLPAEAVGD